MRIALIPVKDLPRAKERLDPVLDAEGRRELTLAFFRDVVAAALASPALDGVAAVTRDEDVLSLATEAGVEGLPEPGGLNQALTSAARKLGERGADTVLVLAADLPFADAESITKIAEAEAAMAIVPSKDGGTNALAHRPGSIPLLFGPDSAAQHVAAAKGAGVETEELDLPSIAFDIDTPKDLERLRAAALAGRPRVGEHTTAALSRLAPPAAPTTSSESEPTRPGR